MEKPVITFSRSDSPLKRKLEALERELLLLKSRVRKIEEKLKEVVPEESEEREDVLLKEIDTTNPRVVEIIMDWVGFMLSRVGDEELPALLDYYVSIGWISKGVADLLLRYSRGLRVESFKGYMEPEDHVKSLEYINRIREAVR